MRFIYADTALCDQVGHHANACRAITGELKRRGIAPHVVAFEDVTEDLQKELGARPFFHWHTYRGDSDPICGWLSAFHQSAETLSRELSQLPSMTKDDVLYVNSAQAAQLMGVIGWLGELDEKAWPHVVMEFGTEAGVDLADGPTGPVCVARDPRGVLNRFASRFIKERVAGHLHLATFDKDSSAIFSLLMSQPVSVLPLPQKPLRPPRLRETSGAITVAVVGHQREDKGYQLMPRVAQLLLESHPNIRLLVHNSKPQEMSEAQEVMRRLAATVGRIELDERAVHGQDWAALLDTVDLMLCPYFPDRFRYGYSAVASEAIANAIPIVSPAGTTLARVMRDFAGGGSTFEKFEPESIANAVGRVLNGFSENANRSLTAAKEWIRLNGPAHTVDEILRLCRSGGK